MKINLLILLIITGIAYGCGPRKLSEKELAEIHLQKTDSLFNKEAYNAAKLHIESIHTQYPKEIAVRKKANSILYSIELIEYKRNLIYADSVIRIKQKELDSITKIFRFEKNNQYQTIGNYVYKHQITEYNPTGTYIKGFVDENGLFYLSSHYCGTYPINHFVTRFNIKDVYAETDTVTQEGFNHSFTDNDKYFERVIYKSEANKDIGILIQQNSGKTIVVTLQGKKKKYTFWLSTNEKKAITEAYNLAVVLGDFKNLERIIDVSKKKIIFLENIIQTDLKKDTTQKQKNL